MAGAHAVEQAFQARLITNRTFAIMCTLSVGASTVSVQRLGVAWRRAFVSQQRTIQICRHYLFTARAAAKFEKLLAR